MMCPGHPKLSTVTCQAAIRRRILRVSALKKLYFA